MDRNFIATKDETQRRETRGEGGNYGHIFDDTVTA